MRATYRYPPQLDKAVGMACWAAETGGLVICATQELADKIAAEAERLGLEIVAPEVVRPPEKRDLPMIEYDEPPWGKKLAEMYAEMFSSMGAPPQFFQKFPKKGV